MPSQGVEQCLDAAEQAGGKLLMAPQLMTRDVKHTRVEWGKRWQARALLANATVVRQFLHCSKPKAEAAHELTPLSTKLGGS